MKQRRKIHEIDSANDLKYRGPLTYQHFRILGWIFLAIGQIAVIISLKNKLSDQEVRSFGEILRTVFSLLGEIATPLFLLANFSQILTASGNFKKLLVKFGALSGAAIVGFTIVYERYAVGILSIGSTRSKAHEVIASFFSGESFVAFNLFLDLFLCTLVMFFLEYRPKKYFTGNKLIIFRLFAIIPIIYELTSLILKILASVHYITIPVGLFPFLTTKPPFEFVVFVALALFIKRRERKFIKNGKTIEEYNEFLGTNANSWHFSVHSAIIMAVAAILDLITAVAVLLIYSAKYTGAEAEEMMTEGLELILKCGFGSSLMLIGIAPVMLLFSYNRKPKNEKLDKLIPLIGLGLMAIVYIEGIYQVLNITLS